MILQQPILFVDKPCAEAVGEVVQALASANLQVLRTFDLQVARTALGRCNCPYHGTDKCDCQYLVLLVYLDKLSPASLIAHGHDGKTWFTLVDPPGQKINPSSKAIIQQALIMPSVLHDGEGVRSTF